MDGCKKLTEKLEGQHIDMIVGITRGGVIIGAILSNMLKLPMGAVSVKRYDDREPGKYISNYNISFYEGILPKTVILLVDDIYDKGVTIDETAKWVEKCYKAEVVKCALITKKTFNGEHSKIVGNEVWVKFPWEV